VRLRLLLLLSPKVFQAGAPRFLEPFVLLIPDEFLVSTHCLLALPVHREPRLRQFGGLPCGGCRCRSCRSLRCRCGNGG
jgi:hypothetical protein